MYRASHDLYARCAMNKQDTVKLLLKNKSKIPQQASAKAFAPVNIALCKYWGKRNQELNLPLTSSLSISLGTKGTTTEILCIDSYQDEITLNQQPIAASDDFSKKLSAFLNLFRDGKQCFRIDTVNTVPVAAGLASSASGFAALVLALDQLFQWQCTPQELSILARLGSGSACRSLWQGFVEWQQGQREDGLDSHGVPITIQWPQLCIGLLIMSSDKKAVSSREAMEITRQTSILYRAWPEQVAHDLVLIKNAITQQNFVALGCAAENNALAMHATMLAANPAICYSQPQTLTAMQQIWQLRQQGLAIYFTQDAGPNLKLLFQRKDLETVKNSFPALDVCEI